MAFIGTLRSWNDERGFGFIAPTSGGRELFVHISAFPRDGSRPTVGETLTYELGRGKDGKPAAIRVRRRALGYPSRIPRARNTSSTASRHVFKFNSIVTGESTAPR
jgi:cold shock CspA family protein